MPGTAENKSYLSETINAYSPWGSRSPTPKPSADREEKSATASTGAATQRGGDHVVSHRHKLSLRSYPPDCPALDAQWFHAVDIPKRKPDYGPTISKTTKAAPAPKKWLAFSVKDSQSIESAFQKLAEEEESREQGNPLYPNRSADLGSSGALGSDQKPNMSLDSSGEGEALSVKVPVNEDYLFDVDINARELGPAYWLGPVYEVRRGTWFYVEGATLRPCDEKLAIQLEEGYLRTKPWTSNPTPQRPTTQSSSNLKSTNTKPKAEIVPKEVTNLEILSSTKETSTNMVPDIAQQNAESSKDNLAMPHTSLLSYRLFGTYMNSVVTYQDSTTAWLVTDDFLSRMSSTVYQRFAGGAHFSGTKVVRGYIDPFRKKAVPRDAKRPITPTSSFSKDANSGTTPERRSTPDNSQQDHANRSTPTSEGEPDLEGTPKTRMRILERQMSNLVASAFPESAEKQDEELRKREEQEIRDAYRDTPGDPQDRPIEHLILVTHGIGQRLGARFESFNFIADCNSWRKTLKLVYNSSPDLQALNAEVDKLPKNCRVQVLPICWRHMLDFPKQSLKHNRKEFDLGDVSAEEYEDYPKLEDITIEGVPALRNIVADLALDVLLFQTPAYKDHIARIVSQECNRIFNLFKQRNPQSRAKVSLCGHSLGSAILFDILCRQERDRPAYENRRTREHVENAEFKLDFDVEDFFCFGSPIGLFQMLNGKTIGGRGKSNKVTLDGSADVDDAFHDTSYSKSSMRVLPEVNTDAIMSSPKCQQLYNIFHPSDPISYRLEPLISPAMASLKPQLLPYTKKGFFTAPVGQGLTGIPARVSQSVSGFWSSFSSGLVSTAINRSLGITAEDAARLSAPAPVVQQQRVLQSVGAGTNIIGGGVIPAEQISIIVEPAVGQVDKKRKLLDNTLGVDGEGQHPPTLIDSDIETLYSGFQKRRKSRKDSDANLMALDESPAGKDTGEEARKLRREEAKIRALNSHGRVDYSIQEGAFDVSFLASIASHLAYWTDEDVCHFLISELLSRQRTIATS